jgi:glycosidase
MSKVKRSIIYCSTTIHSFVPSSFIKEYLSPMLRLLLILFFLPLVGFAQQNPWHGETVYQIYPRSFYDTDGDGIGDLKGIIAKLDHIQQLGFGAIWISPFFLSPQQDFGYDISDYRRIAPEYGDMKTCELLIAEIHKRGMKVIFDLVMNHTSEQHAWFKESASSRDNPKADWYVWRDGKGKNGTRPPTNWKAMIGGQGWQWHEGRKQFYWASFLPFQPDLNYQNPEVKDAMLDVARYWLGNGVDGFRLDIFNSIYEDTAFLDNPPSLRIVPNEENPDGFFQKAKYSVNQPQSFVFATELRAVVDSFTDPPRFLVGEVFGNTATIKQFCEYGGKQGLHSVFLFQTLGTEFNAKAWKKVVSGFEHDFPAPLIPTYVYSNHDRKRSITSVDNDPVKAKLLALMQMTVRGIPFTYYGEELGIPKPTLPLRTGLDPLAQKYRSIPQFMVNMTGESLNRDECRTPMLWDSTTHAGFTAASATPWLPVSANYKEINAAKQWQDSTSLLRFYAEALQLRNGSDALRFGTLQIAENRCSKDVFAYYRTMGDETFLVLLNFSKRPQSIPVSNCKVMLSTVSSPVASQLGPWEGRAVLLKGE